MTAVEERGSFLKRFFLMYYYTHLESREQPIRYVIDGEEQ